MILIATILLSQVQIQPPIQKEQGAEKILQRLQAVTGAKEISSTSATKEELLAYAAGCDRMTPDQAAKGWLKLFNDLTAAWSKGGSLAGPKPPDAIAVLPPPNVWPIIEKLVWDKPAAERTDDDLALKILFDELTGDRAAEQTDNAALLKKLPFQAQTQLNLQLAQRSGDKKWLADAVLKYCEVMGQPWAGSRHADLVTIAGAERARPVLRKFLLSNHQVGSLDGISAPPTLNMLADLTIELLPQLGAAPWDLACNVPSARVYPLLAKKWPHGHADPVGMGNYFRYGAKVTYAVSLELAGKHAQAVAQSNDWDWPTRTGEPVSVAFLEFDRPEYKRAFFSLETAIAARHPDRVDWSELSRVAEEIGRLTQVEALASQAVKFGKLDVFEKSKMAAMEVNGLLATGKLGEAVSLLRKQVNTPMGANDNDSGAGEAALHLVSLGSLTGHKEWMETGIAAVERIEIQHLGTHGIRFQGEEQSFSSLLVSLGRSAEAERYIEKRLAGGAEPRASGGEPDKPQYLEQLADLYYRANRPEDVLALLTRAPGWGGSDLSEVYFATSEPGTTPLGFYAAWALAKTGQTDEALKVLKPALFFERQFDPAYALLLEIMGSKAIPTLDELIARDKLEPRPLIWKSEALRRAGRLAEAESTVRKAIALGPEDADSPLKGLIQALTVLAEIRAAQGSTGEATKLRTSIKALQVTEHADDLVASGLLDLGIKAYKAAIALADDDYYAESKLAIQLSSLARDAEAAGHFRRAYELMATSIGTTGSRFDPVLAVLTDPKARKIGLESLKAFAKKTPDNPRLHLLLGEVYEHEDRLKEAAAEYQRATELDATYFNAWRKVAAIETPVGRQWREKAGLALVRLDPNGFHTYVIELPSMDPASMWNAAHDAGTSNYVIPKALFTLTPTPKPATRNPFGRPRERADWPQLADNQWALSVPYRVAVTPSLRVSHLSIVQSIAWMLNTEASIQRVGEFGGG